MFNSSIIKKKNKKTKNNNNNKKDKESIINEKKENKEKKENNLYFEECIKYVPEKERQNFFYEEELNEMEYNYALEIDKRNFLHYYLSLIKQKQLIIFTFFNLDDYNITLIKISLFICSFSVYFMINTFFFNDETMHEIYEQNGTYDFFYQIPQIVYSTIISTIISIVLKNLSLSQKNVLKIKQIPEISKMISQTFKMIKCFGLKMILFNILGFIIIIFSYYYITMFCIVYTNTQIHLLKDTFTSFCLSLIYPFGLYLIPGFFRIPSLKSNKKDKLYLYKISQLISFI